MRWQHQLSYLEHGESCTAAAARGEGARGDIQVLQGHQLQMHKDAALEQNRASSGKRCLTAAAAAHADTGSGRQLLTAATTVSAAQAHSMCTGCHCQRLPSQSTQNVPWLPLSAPAAGPWPSHGLVPRTSHKRVEHQGAKQQAKRQHMNKRSALRRQHGAASCCSCYGSQAGKRSHLTRAKR